MGKKQKKQQIQVVNQIEVEVEEPVKKKNIQGFLSHHKYINKKTKLHHKKKQQAIQFIKIDKLQVKKAVQALKKFVESTKNTKDLFVGGSEGFIYLQIDLNEIPEHYSIRPIQIPLPVPIYTENYNSRFCIFTLDPQSDFVSKIQNLNVPLLSQCIGYDRAKKHFRDNKQKLKLLNQNDVFFCDWKVYNLLRKPLGKLFYQKKRYPFPIDCEAVPQQLANKYSTYEQYLNNLMNSSYTMLGNGPVYTLKVGRFDMGTADLVKNIMRGTFRLIPYLLQNIDVKNIRQISIKGYNSPSLPIYNHITKQQVEKYINTPITNISQ